MAELKFGDYSQRFEQFYNIFHIAAAVLCLVMAVFAIFEDGHYVFIPPIFMISAASAGLDAYDRFSAGRRKKTSKRAGFAFVALMLLLLAAAYVSVRCFWM